MSDHAKKLRETVKDQHGHPELTQAQATGKYGVPKLTLGYRIRGR